MPLAPAPFIAKMKEYKVTPQEVWHTSKSDGLMKLDWNESTSTPDIVRDALVFFLQKPGAIDWYPYVTALRLTNKIASRLGVSPMQILVSCGYDTALDAIARTYLFPGDMVQVVYPGYDNFRIYAESCGATVPKSVHVSSNSFASSFLDASLSATKWKINSLVRKEQ